MSLVTTTPDQPEDFSIEAFRKKLEREEKDQQEIDTLFSQLSEAELAEQAEWQSKSEERLITMEFKFPKALKACIDEDYGNSHPGIRRSTDPFRAKVLMLLREALHQSGIPFERTMNR